jgi:carotenoid cleavage dioxygenase-like enzyme
MASEFDPSSSPFLQGIFAPTQSELRETPLEVLSGAVPHDLVGTYYRNGPNARFAPSVAIPIRWMATAWSSTP